MKNKSLILLITVLLIGILTIGGTYAYFTISLNAVNNSYVTETHCLNVNYTDNTDAITGTLFPSASGVHGLTGNISVNIDQACELTGRGTLYIHVDSNTSSTLVGTVPAHCEVTNSLETLSNYDTQASCEAATGTSWITNGTALKYVVASGGDLYASGYIKSSDIGTDKAIYDDFSVTGTTKNYSIYVWLDGNLSDSTYIDLPFSGTSKLKVVQVSGNNPTFTGDTPLSEGHWEYITSDYQRVEYIQSTGTQWINTGLDLFSTSDHKIIIDFEPTSFYNYNTIWGSSYDRDTFESWIYSSGSLAARYRITRYGTDNTLTVNTRYLLEVRKEGNQLSKFVNNISFGTGTETNLLTDANFYLFKSDTEMGRYKLYSCKLYRNGILLRNFVPCYRKVDNVAGLYDVVNNAFYPNAATAGDDFTLGPDV